MTTTTTNAAGIDSIIDPDIADYARKRVETGMFADDNKEHYEVSDLLFPGGETGAWRTYPPNAVHDIISLSQQDLTVRNLLIKLINLHKELEAEQIERRATENMHRIWMQHYRDDIELIGARLIEEANDRNWCHEFDEIIETLNRSLHQDLPLREREYEVTVSYSVYTSSTVTVTARDEDGAIEMVRESFSDYVDVRESLEDAVRYNGVDLDEFEAEEV